MWLSKPPAGIQLNRNHPLAQGLVGCWLFNEGSGLRANDLSGNNNTGILTNFEPSSSTSGWTGGKDGTCLQFDNVNDYVDCGTNASLNVKNAITVEALVFPTLNKLAQFVAGHGNTGFQGWYYELFGLNTFFVVANGVANAFPSAANMTVNAWNHVAGTYDGSSVICYLNGIPGTPSALTGAIDYTGVPNTWIGQIQGAGGTGVRYFSGRINHVRLWNRALSLQEIQQLYAQPYAMFWNPSERIRKQDNELLI